MENVNQNSDHFTAKEYRVPEGVFVHPHALLESDQVGAGSRLWAFVHVLSGARIGKDANICDNVFVENDVVIGDRVTVKCGVQLWDGLRVEDDVFIGPNVTFTNDPFPRSKKQPERFLQTLVRKGASIGANATILPGITIGTKALIGAGSVVTRDVPPNAIVVGNPARITGYVDTLTIPLESRRVRPVSDNVPLPTLLARGVSLIRLPEVVDMRGTLNYGEINSHLPFTPKRFFSIQNVPGKEVRGEHAHKWLHQFLICLKGSCAVLVDDGHQRDEVLLETPTVGLHIPPLVWGIQYHYSPDAILLVLASDVYRADDYLRDYDQFLAYIREVPHVRV